MDSLVQISVFVTVGFQSVTFVIALVIVMMHGSSLSWPHGFTTQYLFLASSDKWSSVVNDTTCQQILLCIYVYTYIYTVYSAYTIYPIF